MKFIAYFALIAVLIGGLSSSAHAYGMGDTTPRAMSLGQSYTALARGPESVFWNPANLALSGSPKFAWQVIDLGFTLVAENNSFSVQTYNDNFTEKDHFIDVDDKNELLGDIEGSGLKMNLDIDPYISMLVPINGGVAFSLPKDIHSAITLGLTAGFEGEVPKDMFELMLFGNEFDKQYDIAKWDGSGWAVGSFNWAFAKAVMPVQLKEYLSEFTVGGTLKIIGGAYGEVLRSDGGFITRIEGADLDAQVLTQVGGGTGFGLDLGVAGVTKDRKTTVSVALLNFFDTISWSQEVRQDSLFASASNLRGTRMLDEDVKSVEDVLDNEKDEDGDVVFHEKTSEESFSRSMPAILRLGAAHRLQPRLTVVANYDQAFSDGFGIASTPRLSGGVEYRLVPWFPTRFGLTLGGRSNGSSVGFAFGPFDLSHVRLEALDLALVTRGGLFPGVSKGTALSINFFKLELR